MNNFFIIWIVSGVILLLLAGGVGKGATGNWTGILIDGRGRYSLTHLQTTAWTLLILSAFVATLIAHNFDATKVTIASEILQLMGIAAGSAVLATGVKGAKDAAGSGATVASEGKTVTRPDDTTQTISAKFSQIWLEEEGKLADKVVSITKFQNFIFTLVALVVFAALCVAASDLPAKLPEHLVWLLGISHAGYIGGKIPDKN